MQSEPTEEKSKSNQYFVTTLWLQANINSYTCTLCILAQSQGLCSIESGV